MAPKKATAAPKGKAVVQGGEPAGMQRDGDFEPALSGSRFETVAQLDNVRHMAASKTNEHGATDQAVHEHKIKLKASQQTDQLLYS